MKKQKVRSAALDGLIFILGSAVYAVSVNSFSAPNHIAPGGATGLATLLNFVSNLPIGSGILLINLPLFIIGVWKLGWKFMTKTVIATILLSAAIDLSAPWLPVYEGDILDYGKVMERLGKYREWICRLYINTLNVIHYMHDKYAYEKTQMALHDTEVERFMACGVAGLSVLADSLSAIKYAQVKPVRDDNGYIVEFQTAGEFPTYGNDDDRADMIAKEILAGMSAELKKTKTYRNAVHTLSVLTITSNVMYGKKTGATPDGRKAKEPFAPGANPMHNRAKNGALASLNSVAKLSYDDCRDGISNTFSITPDTLGKTEEERMENLVQILDGYFQQMAHHINVNVMNRELLLDAYKNPGKYPNLTIRVSGYAVHFHKLSREQQREVIMRTFHEAV